MKFDESEPEPIVTPDTPNATKFNPEEASKGKRLDGSESFDNHYSVLRLLNRGTHTRAGNWLYGTSYDREQSRYLKNLAVYDSIACQLDLPRGQKRWGKKLFKRLDYKRFSEPNDGGMGVALAAFCACSYVCWQSGWQTHPSHSHRNPHFKRIQGELGASDKKFRTWYGRFENTIRTT